ncbi:MAG TPA: hypothetical protein VHZ97_05935 [Pseudonocardiaceae bacterium]|jgi:hypothetical protein|nr:hypothetical protein [Pseudonocardiaceae bacterium]
MTGLLDEVLATRGGIERWRAARAVRAHPDMTGPTWAGLGQQKAFVDMGIEVDLRHQRTVFTGFTGIT